MLRYLKLTLRVFAFAFWFLLNDLQAANRIVIKAVASEAYVKERALDEKKKIQTYHFMKAHFFGGNTNDRGLMECTFEDIVTDMAVHLKQQGYYNNPVMGEGDLLIVVHYGVTDYEESLEEMMGYTSFEDMGYSEDMDAAALADFQSNLSMAENMHQSNQASGYQKARLLGLEEAYSTRGLPQDEYELRSMLKEGRYFVSLMAFDLPLMKQGEVKWLWSTRYSIRSAGQSFSDAIRDMNLVAGDFYGKNLKGLHRKRATDNSRVEMGEIEVIGEETGGDSQTN